MRRFNWNLAKLVVATSIIASIILGFAGLRDKGCGTITTVFWILNSPGAALLYLFAIATGFFPGPGEDQISTFDVIIIGAVSTTSSIVWAIIAGFVFRRRVDHVAPDGLLKTAEREKNKEPAEPTDAASASRGP